MLNRFVENKFNPMIGIALLVGLAGCVGNETAIEIEPIENLIDQTSCENIWPKGENWGNPEDVTIHHKTGIAYISSLDHRVFLSADENHRSDLAQTGAIFRYNVPNGGPLEKMEIVTQDSASNYSGKYFFPHGINLWETAEGQVRLFVINKQIGLDNGIEVPDTVKIFEVNGKRLRHLPFTSIEGDPKLSNASNFPDLNDIVAVGKEKFYVTNNPSPNDKFSLIWRSLYKKAGNSKILYFDSKSYYLIKEDLGLANGIAVSKGLLKLYVADSIKNSLSIFSRTDTNMKFDQEKLTLSFDSSLDNIEWKTAEREEILIGSHPNPIIFGLHQQFPEFFDSPSQVLEVSTEGTSKSFMTKEKFYDYEGFLSGSSVAAYYGGKLLIGTTTEKKLLVCDYAEGSIM